MACVHDPDSDKIAPIFLDAEKAAGGPRQHGNKTLRQIMEEIRTNDILRDCIDGDNKIDRTKNVADNATKEMVKYASQYSIADDQLDAKMDEMLETCCKTLQPQVPSALTFHHSTTYRHQTLTHQARPALQNRFLPPPLRQHASHDVRLHRPQLDLPRQYRANDRVGRPLPSPHLCRSDCTTNHASGDRRLSDQAWVGGDF